MRFRTIVLDCDSTLSSLEGVDALAALRGPQVEARVAAMTRDAMEGRLPLEEVYRTRLDLIRPSRDEVRALGRRYAECIVPGAARLVRVLHRLGKEVVVLSGGLLPAVQDFAHTLGVAPERVLAVPVHFDGEGRYLDVASSHPLARSGGKPQVLAAFGPERRPVCLVGDGASDLEAAPAVERFVGFGGVVRRTAVAAAASFYVDSPNLDAVLAYCLDDEERTDPRAREP